jgi:hypothetical protein
MNSQDLRALQEAYMEVYELDEAGATSARLADVVRQRMDGRRDFSVLPQGTPSLSVLMNLENNAKQRASDRYPEQSSVRRGEGGSGVPSRSLDPVRISPKERGRITSKEIVRRSLEKDANRNVPLTRREVPIPVRSRPTPPTNRPTSRTNTPLTPTIRDQRAAEAGFSGPGSSPKGPKLARQTQRGVTTGDNPFDLLRSAATETKPLSKSKGGGNSAPDVTDDPNSKPIAARLKNYKPMGGARYGIAGVGLADSYDIYDIILSHLLDEGFADTEQAAEAIMVNMSEEWRESIILEQTLPSNYTDYKSPAVQASHARSMGSASRMRQMGMNATSVDPKDDAQSNLNAVKSGSGVAKPLSGTTIRSGAGKGFKVGDPGIIIGPNN